MLDMIYIYSCTLCKDEEIKNLHKHYRYTLKNGEEIQKYICKSCSNKKFKNWYAKNPQRFKQILEKSIKRYPEKTIARNLLNYAVKNKMITKPKFCEDCHQVSQRIAGHHTDYTKPLVVKWLCPSCHNNEHKNVI